MAGVGNARCIQIDSGKSSDVLTFHVNSRQHPGLREALDALSERFAQQQIAAITDLGVSDTCYDVVRLIPGFVAHDVASLTPALTS
jgi:hypothetical protein